MRRFCVLLGMAIAIIAIVQSAEKPNKVAEPEARPEPFKFEFDPTKGVKK